MTAKVIQEGFSTAGFNQAGELQQSELALVHAQVPGENGDWMFVVKGTDFCWIKGLPEGEGYYMYMLPLSGSQDTWQQQVEAYVSAGIPDEDDTHTHVSVGDKSALMQKEVFIISE